MSIELLIDSLCSGVTSWVGVIAGFAIFLLSVGVSGYVAWRTGRVVYRQPNEKSVP